MTDGTCEETARTQREYRRSGNLPTPQAPHYKAERKRKPATSRNNGRKKEDKHDKRQKEEREEKEISPPKKNKNSGHESRYSNNL